MTVKKQNSSRLYCFYLIANNISIATNMFSIFYKIFLTYESVLCYSCGNVNWARRMTCNMCNTPKYGKVEQRTGRHSQMVIGDHSLLHPLNYTPTELHIPLNYTSHWSTHPLNYTPTKLHTHRTTHPLNYTPTELHTHQTTHPPNYIPPNYIPLNYIPPNYTPTELHIANL